MSKKSSNFVAKKEVFKEKPAKKVIYEVTSSKPCKAWKPKEAMSIREMLVRTERGQRIDVNTRFRAEGIPDNMYMAEYENVRLPDGSVEKRIKPDLNEDRFEHTPPDGINDIVDVMRYQEELSARKAEMKDRHKKQTVANAQKSAPAPEKQPSDDKVPGAADKETK